MPWTASDATVEISRWESLPGKACGVSRAGWGLQGSCWPPSPPITVLHSWSLISLARWSLALGYPGNARAPGPCTLPASGPRCFSSCSFYPSPFRASISPPWLVLGSFSPSSRSCHLLRNSEGPVPVGTRHPISMVTCRNLGMPGAWSPWMWPLLTGSPAGEVMRGGREEVQHLLGRNVDRHPLLCPSSLWVLTKGTSPS